MFQCIRHIACGRGFFENCWRLCVVVFAITTMVCGSAFVLSQDSDRPESSHIRSAQQLASSQGGLVGADEEEKSDEEMSEDEKTSEGDAAEEMAEEPAAAETQAEPVESQAEEEMSSDEKETEAAPAEEMAHDDKNSDGEQTEEKSEAETPAEPHTEEEMIPENKSDEEMSEDEKPADNESMDEVKAEEKSVEEIEAEEKAAAEKAEQLTAEIERIVTEKLATERALAEKAAAEKNAAEALEKQKAEAARLTAEKAAAQRSIAERAAAEQALMAKIQVLLENELNKAKEQLKQAIELRLKSQEKTIPSGVDLKVVRAELETVRRDFEARIDQLERMQTQRYSAWKRAIGGEYYVCTYRCTPVGSDIEAFNCAYFYPSDPKYVYFYNPKNCVYWGRYIIGGEPENEWEWLPLKERVLTCAGTPPKGQFAWKGPMPLVDQSLDTRQRMLWPSLFGLPGIANELAMRRNAPVPVMESPAPGKNASGSVQTPTDAAQFQDGNPLR